jgi:hypothetical protein
MSLSLAQYSSAAASPTLRFRDAAQLHAVVQNLLARTGVAHLWTEEGPTSDAKRLRWLPLGDSQTPAAAHFMVRVAYALTEVAGAEPVDLLSAATYLKPRTLRALLKLLVAVSHGHQDVDEWLQAHKPLPAPNPSLCRSTRHPGAERTLRSPWRCSGCKGAFCAACEGAEDTDLCRHCLQMDLQAALDISASRRDALARRKVWKELAEKKDALCALCQSVASSTPAFGCAECAERLQQALARELAASELDSAGVRYVAATSGQRMALHDRWVHALQLVSEAHPPLIAQLLGLAPVRLSPTAVLLLRAPTRADADAVGEAHREALEAAFRKVSLPALSLVVVAPRLPSQEESHADCAGSH